VSSRSSTVPAARITLGVSWSQGALILDVGEDRALMQGINRLDDADWYI
jgi:hypothetical protein